MKYSKELYDKWRERERVAWHFTREGQFCEIKEDELDALLDEIERLQAERRWIPVGSGELIIGIPYVPRTHNGIHYWMPLPPPPEEK